MIGPAEEEHRDARAQRRRERADRVDDRTDDERPPPAPHVAELRAEQHERGHRQRVERDRGLHRVDARVEVFHDRRDRHVHDRAVEHHHELGAAEDRDDRPVLHLRPRSRPSAGIDDGGDPTVASRDAPTDQRPREERARVPPSAVSPRRGRARPEPPTPWGTGRAPSSWPSPARATTAARRAGAAIGAGSPSSRATRARTPPRARSRRRTSSC